MGYVGVRGEAGVGVVGDTRGVVGGGAERRGGGGLRWVLVGGTCGEEGWYVGGIFWNFFKKNRNRLGAKKLELIEREKK